MIGSYLHPDKPGDYLVLYLTCRAIDDATVANMYFVLTATARLGLMLEPATGWANQMMQIPSLKPNFYCMTSRLPNVRTHQMYSMITAFCADHRS